MTTTTITREFDATNLTKADMDHIRKYVDSLSKNMLKEKHNFISTKTAMFTVEDFMQEAIINVYKKINEGKATFNNINQLSRYISKSFINYTRLVHRDLTYVKKKNAYIMSIHDFNNTDSVTKVSLIDKLDSSTDNCGQYVEPSKNSQYEYLDFMHILRQEYNICFESLIARKNSKIEEGLTYADHKSKIYIYEKDTCKHNYITISLSSLLIDLYNLSFNELSEKYAKINVFLSKKLIQKIYDEVNSTFNLQGE